MKKPIFKKLMGLALFASALILLDSCYPQGAEFVDELDLVFTEYNEDYDFGAKETYALNEEIPLIGTNPIEYLNDKPGMAPRVQTILSKIRANMEDRGYAEVDVDNDPDMYLPIAALENKTTVVGCGGGGWWGWYPGWYYPGFGGCYYPVGYSYTTGSLFITLWDENSLPAEDNDTTPPKWEVAINGLLQGSESSINSRIEKSIDQAFAQSPYILSED